MCLAYHPHDFAVNSRTVTGDGDSVHAKMKRVDLWLALVTLVAVSTCGYVPTGRHSGDQVASGVRTPSPSPSPSAASSCTTAGPTPRSDVGAAYDPIHKVTVLFGGNLYPTSTAPVQSTSQTWIFDGRCWQLMSPSSSPSPRSVPGGMVFDPAIAKVLLVGGGAVGSRGSFPGDSWVWDGSNWTQLAQTPHFANANAVYDQARKVVVVYGSDNQAFSTWTWDGASWLKQAPAHTPPPRDSPQMCYDDRSNTSLLFGGYGEGIGALGDTWVWNGVDWAEFRPTSSPPARFGAALICGGGRVILAGGSAVGSGPMGDIWSWDGQNWTQITSPHVPTAVDGPGAVFDGSRYLILLGTPATTPLDAQVWAFDGTDWTELAHS